VLSSESSDHIVGESSVIGGDADVPDDIGVLARPTWGRFLKEYIEKREAIEAVACSEEQESVPSKTKPRKFNQSNAGAIVVSDTEEVPTPSRLSARTRQRSISGFRRNPATQITQGYMSVDEGRRRAHLNKTFLDSWTVALRINRRLPTVEEHTGVGDRFLANFAGECGWLHGCTSCHRAFCCGFPDAYCPFREVSMVRANPGWRRMCQICAPLWWDSKAIKIPSVIGRKANPTAAVRDLKSLVHEVNVAICTIFACGRTDPERFPIAANPSGELVHIDLRRHGPSNNYIEYLQLFAYVNGWDKKEPVFHIGSEAWTMLKVHQKGEKSHSSSSSGGPSGKESKRRKRS
jgi:hypothetical protein